MENSKPVMMNTTRSQKEDWADLLKTYNDARREAEEAHEESYYRIESCFDYYVGNHFTDEERTELLAAGKPPIETNLCKKPVDAVVGYFAQNLGDVKAFPVEGGDSASADILSQALKWNMVQMGGRYRMIQAVQAAAICGLGFVSVFLDYNDDVSEGNLKYKSINPRSILIDPATTEPDLSDASYIIYRGFYDREVLKGQFPDYEDEIVEIQHTSSDSILVDNRPDNPRETAALMVDEYWYRDYREVAEYYLQDLDQYVTVDFSDADQRRELEEQGSATLTATRVLPIIRRAVIVEQTLVVEDSDAPDSHRFFPFVPFFFTFTPEASLWEDKFQGVVRGLMAHNDEINKLHSQIISVALQQPLSGHYVEESSIVDEEDFSQATGPGKIIRYRGTKPEPVRGDFTALQAILQIDAIARGNVREAGPNPDFLGSIDGGSGPSAPGITVETRRQAALVAMQSAFENFSMSMKTLGRISVDIMLQNWSTNKFDRVCDSEVPEGFDAIRSGAIFDCIIDEAPSQKTYMFAVFNQLLELLKVGLPAQLLMPSMIKFSGLPAAEQEQILAGLEQMMQPQPGTPPGGAPPQGGGEMPPVM